MSLGDHASPSSREDAARAAAVRFRHGVRTGRTVSIADCIRAVVADRADRASRPPTIAAVRAHLGAMALAELGEAGYRRQVGEVLAHAEELMTALELCDPTSTATVVGRAAKAQVDGDPSVRVRWVSERPLGEVAGFLVAAGYDEPRFATVLSRWGRLEQLVLLDDGIEVRITRCPRPMRIPADADLVSGKPVPAVGLEELRRLLEGFAST